MKYFKSKDFFIIFGLLLLAVIKLYHLNGGFVLGEPDERNYVKVVANFKNSFLPNFDGEDFFHSPPLFHYFSFGLSLIISTKYIALRVVSIIFSFLLAWVVYWYLQSRASRLVAFFGGLLVSLIPLAVFYSRLGLIEMQLSFMAFLYVILLEKNQSEKSFRWPILTGIVLGLGLVTKYSILPLLALPVLALGFEFLLEFIKSRKLSFVFASNFKLKITKVILIYSFALLIFAPITYFNYNLGPAEFKSQLHQDFGLGKRSFDLSVISDYFINLPSFLGWPTLLLFTVGLVPLLKKFKKNLILIGTLILLSYTIGRISLFQPRYIMIIIPFIAVVAALGLGELLNWLKAVVPRYKNLGLVLTLVIILSLITQLSQTIESTNHNIIEQVGSFVAQENKTNQWVVTNYWPSAFVDEVGYKTTWYTLSQGDAAAPSGGGKTKYTFPPSSTADILNKEGGWVITESLYSGQISKNPERKNLIDLLKRTQNPVKVFTDYQPNWPFYDSRENTISVYHLTPK